MIKEQYKYSDTIEKVIGCALKVHQRLRSGYPELIYPKWIIEFKKNTLSFLREIELPILYDHIEVGKRRVAFLTERKIIIEIKAVSELTDAHPAQAINYLEALNPEAGLLINFGSKTPVVKRLTNYKFRPSVQSNESM